MTADKRVFYGIIVLYNPETDLFLENIKLLVELGIKVYVYDNSVRKGIIDINEEKITSLDLSIVYIHNNGDNKGLSFAFNDLISRVIDAGEDNGVFFFDQDSDINPESILHLIADFKTFEKREDIGIIAGMPMRKNGKPYRLRQQNPLESGDIVEVTRVPTSYSLIPIRTFRKLGLFEADFFIDQIDNNYSLRCQQNSLKVLVDKRAVFTHEIGLGDVMFFNKFLFPYGSPFRHYYQVRNLILSYSRYKMPTLKKLMAVLTRSLIVFYIGILKGQFRIRMNYLFKGIKDGFNNKGGKLSE